MKIKLNNIPQIIFCFLVAMYFNSCTSGQNELMNKVWKYSSYSDSLDMSQIPAPPVIPSPPVGEGALPSHANALILYCIQIANKGQSTFVKFEDDFNSTDKNVANFNIFIKENSPIITGKVRFWNDQTKFSASYKNLSNIDRYEIITVTKDKLVLRFNDGGMFVTANFINE